MRFIWIGAALAAAALTCGSASAQVPAAQRTVVASTAYFHFHSDPLYNLHDLLTWRTSGLRSAPSDSCTTASSADWQSFARAQQLYASKRGSERNRFVLALRFEVAGFPGLGLQPDSIIAPALALLNAALPAYRTCWWEEHDRRNRSWIAQLVPRLQAHEDSIATRLARLFQNDWEKPFPVDVVTFASSRARAPSWSHTTSTFLPRIRAIAATQRSRWCFTRRRTRSSARRVTSYDEC